MGQRRKRYSLVTRALWTDPRFVELSAPDPCGQVLWLYLLTSDHQGPLPGLLRAGPGALADGLGWSVVDVVACLAELEAAGLVSVRKRPPLLWVRNAMRHNPPQSPNVVKSWAAYAAELPECKLRDEALLTMRGHLSGPFLTAYDDHVLAAVGLKATGKATGKAIGKALSEGGGGGGARPPRAVVVAADTVVASGPEPAHQGDRKAIGKAIEKPCPNQEQEQEQEQEVERVSSTRTQAAWLARYLERCIRTHSPNARCAPDGWIVDIERLLRLDDAPPAEVRQVIRWVHVEDPEGFWRPNILSGIKLRKQFDALRLRADKAGSLVSPCHSLDEWLKRHVGWLKRLVDRMAAEGAELTPEALSAAASADRVDSPSKIATEIIQWLEDRQ